MTVPSQAPRRRPLWKSGALALALVLATIAVILFMMIRATGNRKVHVAARFISADDSAYFVNSNFFRYQCVAVSNFLNSPANRLMLARTSKTDEKDFAYAELHPVRDTRIFYIHYAGADSNSVLSVASNAAAMLVPFLATNEPHWYVTNIDSRCYAPVSPWDRFGWWLRQKLP